MPTSFTMSIILPVTPKQLYTAWLDSHEHSACTGSPAKFTAKVGGSFKAWDGYISGTTLELRRYRRILQAWRTTEFAKDAPDSLLEVLIARAGKGAKLTLRHSQVPSDQVSQYKSGWQEFYFTPMKAYFQRKAKRAQA
jgi:activator of HSP90 ATPase